jgi:hypothetical protein
MRRKAIIAATLAVVLASVAGIAVASIPDSNGVIHGCRNLKSGALRVIDSEAGQTCDSKTEAALTWNQTGPQGPAGSPGLSNVHVVIDQLHGSGTVSQTLLCPRQENGQFETALSGNFSMDGRSGYTLRGWAEPTVGENQRPIGYVFAATNFVENSVNLEVTCATTA